MKTIRRIVLALVLLVVVGVFILYKSLDHILKTSVETEATKSLNLQTTLGAASLSLFGGELKLDDLKIASPPGFAAPAMLGMGSTDLKVTYGQLRSQPIHVANITLDKPLLVIENINGSLNFKKAADGMPKSSTSPSKPGGSTPAPSGSSSSTKMVIDDLTIKDATVVVRPGFPGLPPEITIPIATFTMKNVGTSDDAQNGAALQDVVMQVITAMASHASASGKLPLNLQSLLNGNISDVLKGFGDEAQKRVMAVIPPDISKNLNGLLNGGGKPADLLNNALGGGATSKPSILDPGKAADTLQGLFGKHNK